MSDDRDALLPACQKCKLRKVRCDRRAPKCGNCVKGNVACIIIDPVTGERYARDFIRQLEETEKQLRQRLGDDISTGAGAVETVTSTVTSRSDEADRTPWGPATGETVGSHSGFVGDGSGLSFLHNILSDAKWQHHRAHILRQLANRPRILKQQLTPHTLPPLDEAQRLLDNYFTRFHIHHTFLLRGGVLDIFNRIYCPTLSYARPSSQDYFRLFMVFAISSTTRYRAGLSSEHPYGYYLAAETYLGCIPIIKDVEAIQNLLLIARFGMYHHIGTSLWEISQLCMRQCIEWRLHMRSSEDLNPITEQHRRRIFWECYVLDRYSSGILGRPFAIVESEISVPLPLDADDETVLNSSVTSLDKIPNNSSNELTELSVFIFCIKLRKISSRVHSTFYTGRSTHPYGAKDEEKPPNFESIGHVYASFFRFQKELDAWRSTSPAFPNPRSLYERPEWHDFLYEKDRLLLARGAIHNVPSRPYACGGVAKEMLSICYASATRVIELYADLMGKGAITWTRSYFQVIFTAGLTIIYSINLDILRGQDDAELDPTDPLRTLNLCSSLLSYFKEKMPDAGSFAVVFDVLKGECIKDRLNCVTHQIPSIESVAESFSPTTFNHQQEPISSTSHDQSLHPLSFDSLHPSLDHSDAIALPPIMAQTNIDHFDPHSYNSMAQDQHHSPQDFGFGLTDDLMNQLEAGLGEYAWDSINMDLDFW